MQEAAVNTSRVRARCGRPWLYAAVVVRSFHSASAQGVNNDGPENAPRSNLALARGDSFAGIRMCDTTAILHSFVASKAALNDLYRPSNDD